MNKDTIQEILEGLKNGQYPEIHIKKEDFPSFRAVLVQREDFKHFRGIAQRGGDVIYLYTETARS